MMRAFVEISTFTKKAERGGEHLDIPKAGLTFLMALYDKNEKDDISSDEKRIMRGLADILKREAESNAKN